ncbi:four-carbon acid sugar kinase family protein [Streptomyces smyrnaeus]|uniref:four-carbon acid sugar kinase family protein n=1 Tax=Streptomyces smyrnaeus TaxID=1387713 RepID=UPI0033C83167
MSAWKGAAPVMALADDLSGAAEVAALLRLPARLTLGPPQPSTPEAAGRALVVDLDSRQATSGAAAAAVWTVLAETAATPPPRRRTDPARSETEAAEARREPVLWYKKSDSLLRGNVGAEAAAFAQGAEAVVVAMALPRADRVVREGVLHVEGVPLHESAAWRAEGRRPPRSVTEALAPLPTARVPVEAVRQGVRGLADLLRSVASRGRHPVCDAATDADLAAITEAAVSLGPGYRLLGSGGLAASLGRHIGTGTSGRETGAGEDAPAAVRPLLVVAGSAEPVVAAQIARLVAAGARHMALAPGTLAAEDPVPLPPLTADAVTVVSVDPAGGIRPDRARRVVAGLARTVAALPGRPDLVLTGGETARRVLDAAGVTALSALGEIHHGAVHSRTDDGRSVVTRPGSFGGPDSLHRIAAALRPRLVPAPSVPAPPVPEPEPPFSASAASSTPLPCQGVTQ